MKRAPICVFFLICLARSGFSGNPLVDLTVVLDFKGLHTPRSVAEMKQEAQQIVKDAGVHLDWSSTAEASQRVYLDLVVVRFDGACIIKPDPNVYDELGPPTGPLAFTYITDGAVEPFGEVACDKVAASVRSAMWGSDFAVADILLGRALGRVLVHEIVHMLTKSADHAHSGVEKSGLSGKQLISRTLPLSASDLERLRQNLSRR
jgi:hypothetical protein